LGVGINGNAPEAFVGDADALAGGDGGDLKLEARGQSRCVDGVAFVHRDAAIGPIAFDHGPMRGLVVVVLKDAVLNQFAVKAAIVGVVDFFGHHSVERRTDLDAGVLQVDVQGAGVGVCLREKQTE